MQEGYENLVQLRRWTFFVRMIHILYVTSDVLSWKNINFTGLYKVPFPYTQSYPSHSVKGLNKNNRNLFCRYGLILNSQSTSELKTSGSGNKLLDKMTKVKRKNMTERFRKLRVTACGCSRCGSLRIGGVVVQRSSQCTSWRT